MLRTLTIAGFAALLAATSLSPASVHAQFGPLFGDPPPRPPGSVPRGQQPPPQYDDEEEVPELPQGRLLPTRPGMGAPPPGAVQSQPLAPPPGSNTTIVPQNSPGTRQSDLPPPLGVSPSQPAPQQQPGVANAPPAAAPGGRQPPKVAPPTPATLQPGDEVVTEPPAQKIVNKKASFSGLDKITGRIINFDADIGETVQFGALRVKTDACYTRPATEAANTDAFVEVDEITLQGEVKRIFSGWMFAASPGLHGVEHPIYDIWLTDCKQPEATVATTQPEAPRAPPPAQKRAAPKQQPRAQQQPLQPPPGFPAFRQ
jgi:hypothetical protein